jgi:hypothetical protein
VRRGQLLSEQLAPMPFGREEVAVEAVEIAIDATRLRL